MDEGYHARYRRCVNNTFAMSSLVSYEPLVDSTTALFLSQTEKLFASRNATCSFSQWLQFFAFDVIGELTWSKPIGFIEKNQDIDGIIGFISSFLDYAGPVSSSIPTISQPKLHVSKNPKSKILPTKTSTDRPTPRPGPPPKQKLPKNVPPTPLQPLPLRIPRHKIRPHPLRRPRPRNVPHKTKRPLRNLRHRVPNTPGHRLPLQIHASAIRTPGFHDG